MSRRVLGLREVWVIWPALGAKSVYCHAFRMEHCKMSLLWAPAGAFVGRWLKSWHFCKSELTAEISQPPTAGLESQFDAQSADGQERKIQTEVGICGRNLGSCPQLFYLQEYCMQSRIYIAIVCIASWLNIASCLTARRPAIVQVANTETAEVVELLISASGSPPFACLEQRHYELAFIAAVTPPQPPVVNHSK